MHGMGIPRLREIVLPVFHDFSSAPCQVFRCGAMAGWGLRSPLNLALAVALLAYGLCNPCARAQSPSEHQVKAVFLYNFAKFIDWPSDPSPDSRDPVVIGIVGEDPFGNLLERTVKGKTVDRREIVIKRFKRGQDLRGCHILFVSSSESKHLRAIFESLKGASVLTVGETEGFARLGGVINFTLEDNQVHFEVNVDAAERARLKISSKLLSLAKIVRDEPHGGKG